MAEIFRTVPELAEEWHLSQRKVADLVRDQHGVKKWGRTWRVPQSVANRLFKEATPPRQCQPTYFYEAKRGADGEMVRVRKERPVRKKRVDSSIVKPSAERTEPDE